MEEGLQAAHRRFPMQGDEIDRLASTDGNFRSLCEDLAEAEHALAQWGSSTSPQRSSRQAEYRTLVEELAGELSQILTARSVDDRPGLLPKA